MIVDSIIQTGGVFNAGTGTVNWQGQTTVNAPGIVFNNLTVGDGFNGQGVTLTGTVNVNGDLLLNVGQPGSTDSLFGTGTINVNGNINTTMWTNDNGSTVPIVWTGTGSKTFNQSAGTQFPNLTINGSGSLAINGTPDFVDNFIYQAGSVTVNAATTSFSAYCSGYALTPGTIAFNNVSIGDGSMSCTGYTLTGTMTVNGNLSFNTKSNGQGYVKGGGTINVTGNLADTSWADNNSSVTVVLLGTGTQTLTQGTGANFPKGTLKVNNASNAVQLGSNFTASTNGHTISALAQGILLEGYALSAKALTLAATTFVTLGGGSLTVNGSPVLAGPYSGGTVN
jgi:hypothetical protein